MFQSVLLLSHQRLGVLYMDSGKVKNIPKLDHLLSDVRVLSCSSNGNI